MRAGFGFIAGQKKKTNGSGWEIRPSQPVDRFGTDLIIEAKKTDYIL